MDRWFVIYVIVDFPTLSGNRKRLTSIFHINREGGGVKMKYFERWVFLSAKLLISIDSITTKILEISFFPHAYHACHSFFHS